MSLLLTDRRERAIERSEREGRKWNGLVDSLLEAFDRSVDAPPQLAAKMEELRHKRDTLSTKVAALRHHKRSGWKRAQLELGDARRELRNAWRSVIATLDRESLFI